MIFANFGLPEDIAEKDYIALMKDETGFFKDHYFPDYEDMGNGEVYIQTTQYVYSATGSCYHKYFAFDENGHLLTDPKYGQEFTRVDPKGYIMRITLPSPASGCDFAIDYFIKMDRPEFQQDLVLHQGVSEGQPSNVKSLFVFKTNKTLFNNISDPFRSDMDNPHREMFFLKYLDYNLA